MPYKIQDLKDFSPASLKMLNDNIRMLALKMFGSLDFEDLGSNLSSDSFEITKDHARFYGSNGNYTEFNPNSGGMKWHKQIGTRYIRNYVGGNSVNINDDWVEIQALDKYKNNIALNKAVTISDVVKAGSLSCVTNGNTSSSEYVEASMPDPETPIYVQIDLGAVYEITTIKIWHYWADGRSYFNNVTQVSSDGVNWDTLFSSDYEGESVETADGQTITVDLSEDYSYLKVTGMVNVVGYGSITTIQLPDGFKGQNYKVQWGINYAAAYPASGDLTALHFLNTRVWDITAADRALGQFRLDAGFLCVDLVTNSMVVSENELNLQINFMAIC